MKISFKHLKVLLEMYDDDFLTGKNLNEWAEFICRTREITEQDESKIVELIEEYKGYGRE